MKIKNVFPVHRLLTTAEESVKESFTTERMRSNQDKFSFGVVLILGPDSIGEKVQVQFGMISPRSNITHPIYDKTVEAAELKPFALGLHVNDMPLDGFGEYKCIVCIDKDIVYEEVLFRLVASESIAEVCA